MALTEQGELRIGIHSYDSIFGSHGNIRGSLIQFYSIASSAVRETTVRSILKDRLLPPLFAIFSRVRIAVAFLHSLPTA